MDTSTDTEGAGRDRLGVMVSEIYTTASSKFVSWYSNIGEIDPEKKEERSKKCNM